MNIKDVPCKDCICIPICRHKEFYQLLHDCAFLPLYDPKIPDPYTRSVLKLLLLQTVLRPTTWQFTREYHASNIVAGKYRVSSTNNHVLGKMRLIDGLY